MPFDQHIPRPFTPADVRAHTPSAPGVYGISNAREWLYIGAADDIQVALLRHIADLDSSLMRRRPVGFVFEVCDGAHRTARHHRLILEYEPTLNRRSPN